MRCILNMQLRTMEEQGNEHTETKGQQLVSEVCMSYLWLCNKRCGGITQLFLILMVSMGQELKKVSDGRFSLEISPVVALMYQLGLQHVKA